MRTFLNALALAAISIAFNRAHADVANWDGECGSVELRMDYHRDPVLRWACYEGLDQGTNHYQYGFQWKCDYLDKVVKWSEPPSFKCEYVHEGFDRHYKLEAKKPKAKDRDEREPLNYCFHLIDLLTGGVGNPTPYEAWGKEDVKNEFTEKVKTIACAYDEKKARKITLENGKLTFYVDATILNSDFRANSLVPQLRRLLPVYNKWYEENR